jgi:glycosyltransferase involved in cell wall biosynthesis
MNNGALPVVYIVDASVAVTGAFVAARQIARALAGTATVVLVLPQGHAIAPSALQDFSKVMTVPMVTPSKKLRALLHYLPALCIAAWRLKKAMREDAVASLILNDFYLMHGALLRVLGYRGRIVVWVRGDPVRFAGFLARPMLWLAARTAQRVVAVSEYIRSRLPRALHADILYDGYDGVARVPPSWAVGDVKTLVYVGNYIRGKGQDMALAAFAIAAAQDATLRLDFYGGDMGLAKNRAYRRALEVMAAREGITHRVAFHEFTPHIAPVLATAYAALNFSVSESFSMTVLEASGAGVPVIATASGGPQEIVVEGVTGHLVAVGDATAAATRIVQLASDIPAAMRMGEAAAAHIATHFSHQRFCAQLVALLRLS